MNPDVVKGIAQSKLPIMQRRLRLEEWDISLTFDRLEGADAEIEIAPKYRRAEMFIDVEKHDGVNAVFASILHELIHLVFAELDLVQEVIEAHVPHGASREALRVVVDYACELAVRRVEAVFEALDISPELIAEEETEEEEA